LSSDEPKPIDLLFEDPSGNRRWVALAPRQLSKDTAPALGVLFAHSNKMLAPDEFFGNFAANHAKPKLQDGDRLIAINGTRLADSRKNEEGVFVAWQVDELLETSADEPLTLTVLRTDDGSKEVREVDVVVPPQPMRWLGFTIRMGPVTSIRDGSAAEQAGLKVGDVIYGINGATVGDPLTLPTRFAQLGTQEIRLNVWQKSEKIHKYERRQLVVTPQSTEINSTRIGPDLALEGIGLSYTIRNVVWKVADGSPAAKVLKPGDQIQSVTRVASDESLKKQILDRVGKDFFKTVELKTPLNWIQVRDRIQELPEGIEVQLKIRRGEKNLSVQLAPKELPGQYYNYRGLPLAGFEREFIAPTWAEALSRGVAETKGGLLQVAGVLKLLITGRVSADNLGGPIRIATIAGHEANISVARLLMFLTFLSTNLALLNALPVPVLDGGHFMFLTIELVRRRPVPEEWQQRLSFVGLAALVLLMFFVFFNDIRWFAS
jgi:regulator of sigma E protease